MRWMEERIGRERAQGAYAFRTLKKSGAVLVFGSDSPGTNAARYFLNPVYGLYAAVSRQTLTGEPKAGWFPAERLTIEEAIEAATKNPAWASFEESIKGTLTPGKLADIAVFDTNLVEVGKTDPARLLKAKVRSHHCRRQDRLQREMTASHLARRAELALAAALFLFAGAPAWIESTAQQDAGRAGQRLPPRPGRGRGGGGTGARSSGLR